eukprot:16432527-Heterocapsa_arctica.AAC.1
MPRGKDGAPRGAPLRRQGGRRLAVHHVRAWSDRRARPKRQPIGTNGRRVSTEGNGSSELKGSLAGGTFRRATRHGA